MIFYTCFKLKEVYTLFQWIKFFLLMMTNRSWMLPSIDKLLRAYIIFLLLNIAFIINKFSQFMHKTDHRRTLDCC